MDQIMIVVAVVVVLAMVGYFIYRRMQPDAVSIVTPEIEALRKKAEDLMKGTKP